MLVNFALLVVGAILSNVAAIPTISAVGSKFFTSDGKQYFLKGVAYQLTDDDPLIDTAQCTLDATLMQQLGANAIRVYHVDAYANHTGCMNVFAQMGIYLWVDMDSFYTYIRYDTTPSWTQNKSDSFRAVMDEFQQFSNTGGFYVGNEVLNTLADSGSAPYVLAAAADLKAYRKLKGYRDIPIGYSATDTAVLRPMLQEYLVCRPNVTERLDFYALNSYEWCGAVTTYQTSGYDILESYAANYPVPIFFSEDGCNTVPPRDFNDQAAIFGPQMVGTWSGAIIYEWIQEMNDYGLISYGPFVSGVNEGASVIDGFTRGGTPTPVAPDFTNLQAQWATLTPAGVALSVYAATYTTSAPPCPPYASGWTVDPSAALPTIGVEGVTAGLPSGIPTGSITPYKTTADTRTPSATGTAGSASASASPAASSSAAGKTNVSPFSSREAAGFMGMLAALFTLGAGFVLWL